MKTIRILFGVGLLSSSTWAQANAVITTVQPNNPNMPWTLTGAINHRQQNVAEMLIKMGVDVNAADTNGESPLEAAARKGDLPIARLLLSHGATVEARSASGMTAIHTAALGGNASVVDLLIDYGADVNQRATPGGETALYFAAAFGRPDIVRLLLARGADRTISDAKGTTPVVAARKAAQTEIAGILEDEKPEARVRQAAARYYQLLLSKKRREAGKIVAADSRGDFPNAAGVDFESFVVDTAELASDGLHARVKVIEKSSGGADVVKITDWKLERGEWRGVESH